MMNIGCMYSFGRDAEEVREEWRAAREANEPKYYYKVRMWNGGITYKVYKPSEAAFLWKDSEDRLTQCDEAISLI